MIRPSCLASSVLPTPVGPEKRKLPIGFVGEPRPDRESRIALANASIAASWPYTTCFSSGARLFRAVLSSLETLRGGMRAIFATTCSISGTPITGTRSFSGLIRCSAPASSITSMALSGRCRSTRCLAERSTADSSAGSL